MRQAFTGSGRAVLGGLMLSVALLSGCASTGSGLLSGSSADPRLTQGENSDFFSRSGFQACVGGALIGITACMLSNSGNKFVCSAIAGVAACGIAMGGDYYLSERRRQYANTTDRLAAMRADVEKDSTEVQARTQAAQGVIADNKKELEQITTDLKNKTLEQEQAEKRLKTIDANIARLNKELGNMNERVQKYREVADAERGEGNPASVKALDREIDAMNLKVAVLQKEVDDLYTMRSAVTLG